MNALIEHNKKRKPSEHCIHYVFDRHWYTIYRKTSVRAIIYILHSCVNKNHPRNNKQSNIHLKSVFLFFFLLLISCVSENDKAKMLIVYFTHIHIVFSPFACYNFHLEVKIYCYCVTCARKHLYTYTCIRSVYNKKKIEETIKCSHNTDL